VFERYTKSLSLHDGRFLEVSQCVLPYGSAYSTPFLSGVLDRSLDYTHPFLHAMAQGVSFGRYFGHFALLDTPISFEFLYLTTFVSFVSAAACLVYL
jgi:hypothetical protein